MQGCTQACNCWVGQVWPAGRFERETEGFGRGAGGDGPNLYGAWGLPPEVRDARLLPQCGDTSPWRDLPWNRFPCVYMHTFKQYSHYRRSGMNSHVGGISNGSEGRARHPKRKTHFAIGRAHTPVTQPSQHRPLPRVSKAFRAGEKQPTTGKCAKLRRQHTKSNS